MRPIHGRVSAIVLSLLTLSASRAMAQSEPENRATARELAEQGHDAFEARDYKKSADLFRRADALFHAPTISIGLARAQAAEGLFVESCENYNRILREANTSTPIFAQALEDAKKEVATVEGRRSKAVISVSGPSTPSVSIDGVPLKNEVLGVPLFVNPGTHTVKATATGYKATSEVFTVGEGATQSVSVPMEAAPAEAAAPGSPAPGVAPAPAPALPIDVGTPPPHRDHLPSFIAFGVGGAGLVVGAIAGGVALGKHGTLVNECPGGTCTTTSSQSDLSSYHAIGAVSTVGFIVGGVGIAAGAILWFVNPSADSGRSAFVSPYVGPGSLGAVGAF